MSEQLEIQGSPAFSNAPNATEISRSAGGRRFQDAGCVQRVRKSRTVNLIYRDKERE